MDRLATGFVRVASAGLVAGSILLAGATHAQDVLIGETSATFEWGQAAGTADFYEVYVSRSSRGGSYELEQTVAANPSPAVTLDGTVGEVLRIRVIAGNDEAKSALSHPSPEVRFGLPPDMPSVGTPGVIVARVAGETTNKVYFDQPDTGDVWRYELGSKEPAPVLVETEPDLDWAIAASGDFDGDDEPDLLWRHAVDGRTRLWLMSASTHVEIAGPDEPGPDFTAETTGDLDGNAQDDVFWRKASGETLAWLRVGNDFTTQDFPSVPDASWNLLSAGDFDGDGLDDLFWRNDSTADTYVWAMRMAAAGRVSVRFQPSDKQDAGWEVFEVSDENQDGTVDLHWRSVESHDQTHWWFMDGAEVLHRE